MPDAVDIPPQFPAERFYVAAIRRIVDGDTLHADIDLGLHIGINDYPIRLLGCNAAPVTTPSGAGARDRLTGLLPAGTRVVLGLVKDYKYGGEFVADVWYSNAGHTGWVNLVAQLIAEQWVAPWGGAGSQPLPPWPRTVTP